jgi:hypothetical protein
MPRRGRPCRVDCELGTWVAHAAKNHKPLEAIVPLVKGLSICRSIETAHRHVALSVRPLPVYLGAKTSQNEGVFVPFLASLVAVLPGARSRNLLIRISECSTLKNVKSVIWSIHLYGGK